MSVYLISYDLIPPGQHYKRVHEAIIGINPNSWAKPLESVWLVNTGLTIDEVKNRVAKACDAKDKILVIEVGRSASGYRLPDEVWKWIQNNVFIS
jgi:hypothetical protein